MMSQDNLAFMQAEDRQYIIGASKGTLKQYEQALLQTDWKTIREGLEVKLCPNPQGGKETFILCRSRDRQAKEKAMHQRFEQRIDVALEKLKVRCSKRRYRKETLDRRVGRIMAKNSRAAGLYEVTVTQSDQRATVAWSKKESWRRWAELSEGCYLLRTNVKDWSARGSLAGLHPTDRGRGGVPDSQKRLEASAYLAPKGRSLSRLTSWSASWRMCYGRPYPR